MGFFVMLGLSYLYRVFVMDSVPQPSFTNWLAFVKGVGLPFLPILGPLWAFLRGKYGHMVREGEVYPVHEITVNGENKKEPFRLKSSDFIYAKAEGNYVIIVYRSGKGIQKKMLRGTLASINKQISNALPVHRSYSVNLSYLKRVKGNSRKRFFQFTLELDAIPISQNGFEAIRDRMRGDI